MKPEQFFLPDNPSTLADEVRGGPHPWSAVDRIGALVAARIDREPESGPASIAGFARLDMVTGADGKIVERSLHILRTTILDTAIHVGPGIVVEAGTMLEAGAILKAPCVIEAGSEIRQGAYIRGDVYAGKKVVIGHVTEVKNAILMDGTAAGHFAYVGDAILGAFVNLGAGTKIANLQFRTPALRKADTIAEVVVTDRHERIPTGRGKLGAVIGDFTEIGCNTVTSPGCCIGHGCWVYPNTTVPKGFYLPEQFIMPDGPLKVRSLPRPA